MDTIFQGGKYFLSSSILAVILFFSVDIAAAATTVPLSGFSSFLGKAASSTASALASGDVNNDGYQDVLIGASADSTGGSSAGAVYLFYGSSTPFSGDVSVTTASAAFLGTTSFVSGDDAGYYGEEAGSGIAVGDLNGDGYADIVIGAPAENAGGSQQGAAYIFYGKATAFSGTIQLSSADAKFRNESTSNALGNAITIGNINGDGYQDLFIADNGDNAAGAVYLIYGQADNFSGSPSISQVQDTKFTGGTNADAFGTSLTTGDINNDSYDDLVVGAVGADANGGTPAAVGAAYLFYGQSAVFSSSVGAASANAKYLGTAVEDQIGVFVSTGDINNDSYDDILIGSWAEDTGGTSAGTVYLEYGQSAAISGTIAVTALEAQFVGEDAGDRAGTLPQHLEDFNNDGYDDILISGYQADSKGIVYIFSGKQSAFSGAVDLSTADLLLPGETTNEQAGYPPFAMDLNADGYAELLVSAPGSSEAAASAGKVYIGYLGLDRDDDGTLGSAGLLYTGSDCSDTDATVTANQTYYVDADADGVGSTTTASVCAASAPSGYSATNTDCSDTDATVSVNQTYYQDSDADTLGNPSQTTAVCQSTAPSGYVTNDDDTDDTIQNNGLEIDDDGLDNDGDGTIDEKNTVSANGKHPEYGTTDATSKDAFASAVLSIAGGKNGKINVTFADNAVYSYPVFDIDTDAKTIVKSWGGKGYLLVLHPKGKKMALVNAYTGKVMEKETITDTKYKKNGFKTFDLRGDGSLDVVVTSKQDDQVRLTIIKVKPSKDNKLKKKSSAKATHSKVDVNKTEPKKKSINLRNADKKVLRTYEVTEEYVLIEI